MVTVSFHEPLCFSSDRNTPTKTMVIPDRAEELPAALAVAHNLNNPIQVKPPLPEPLRELDSRERREIVQQAKTDFFAAIREQYRIFVDKLREAAELLNKQLKPGESS